MNTPGPLVPIPAFASVIVTHATELTAGLQLLTLSVGAGTSIIMFLFWLRKYRRQGRGEDRND